MPASPTPASSPADQPPSARPKLTWQGYLLRWLGGALLATLLMWAGSWNFLNSTVAYTWDDSLQQYVPEPGTTIRWRREGWATTTIGKHSITSLPDVTQIDRPMVALWGDSYVEALQVADQQKPAQQVTRIWNSQHDMPLVCVGIGGAGRSIADYWWLMPRYEQLIVLRAHYILVPNMGDVMPDGKYFRTQPHFELTPLRKTPEALGLRPIVRDLRLEFLWEAVKNVRTNSDGKTRRRLRFRPGPVDDATPAERSDELPAAPLQAWVDLLDALRERTDLPVTFIYAPHTPWIDGREVRTDDRDAALAATFSQMCRQRGIGFIDLAEPFVGLYRESGRFPRGFYHGGAASGHLNELGHRLVAEAICQDLRENVDAIHAD